jgi:thioredoxin 1
MASGKKKKKKKGSWLASRSHGDLPTAQAADGAVLQATDKTFRELVLRSDQPVLVDFWADWCAPCRQVAPILTELAQQYKGLARIVKLDVEKNRKIPERYDVRSIPTLLVFKGGEVIQTFVGATSKGELTKVIGWALRVE